MTWANAHPSGGGRTLDPVTKERVKTQVQNEDNRLVKCFLDSRDKDSHIAIVIGKLVNDVSFHAS
jgi:hypothetical protein